MNDQAFLNIYKDEIEEEYSSIVDNLDLDELDNDQLELINQIAKATVMNKIMMKSIQYL